MGREPGGRRRGELLIPRGESHLLSCRLRPPLPFSVDFETRYELWDPGCLKFYSYIFIHTYTWNL